VATAARAGGWRTLGLFDAGDADELATIRASMPLSVWRTDDATPLGSHPNDPGRGEVTLDPEAVEFLTTFTVTIPPGTPTEDVDGRYAGEKARTRELAGEGHLLRLWALPTDRMALGHWQSRDREQMDAITAALPLAAWLAVDTVPLTRHPSDPATAH
jgi:muconolactone delta-isomerase